MFGESLLSNLFEIIKLKVKYAALFNCTETR